MCKLCQRYVGGRSNGAWASCWKPNSGKPTACSRVTRLIRRLSRSFSSCLEQDATLLAAVWWRGCKTASHRRQTPFLHIRFDENKSHLSEVDVDVTGSICPHGWKEILTFQVVCNFVQLFTISREEDTSGSRSISYTNDISLHIWRPVGVGRERLVVPSMTGGKICD